MNENFTLAGKGLKYLFLVQIFALAAIVVAFVPLLGWIASVILIIAGLVLEILGPYVARETHDNFRIALWASIATLIVNIISGLLRDGGGWLGTVLDIVQTVLRFAIVYFVCTAAEALLDAKGDGELAQRAATIWKLYVGYVLLTILCTLVGGIPFLSILTGVVAVVVRFVAYILLLIFYYKASQSLLGE